MKKSSFFLLPVCFLLIFASCNSEKRLYRKGWYFQKNNPHTFTANPESNPIAGASALRKYEKSDSMPASFVEDSSLVSNNAIDSAVKSHLPDSSLPKKNIKEMSRQELLKSMKEKGCAKPDKEANTIYWLAVVSICICWMLPLALILAFIVISMCESAEKKVIAKGECPRENLALIDKGRRMAKGLLYVSLFVGIALTALLIAGLIILLARIFT